MGENRLCPGNPRAHGSGSSHLIEDLQLPTSESCICPVHSLFIDIYPGITTLDLGPLFKLSSLHNLTEPLNKVLNAEIRLPHTFVLHKVPGFALQYQLSVFHNIAIGSQHKAKPGILLYENDGDAFAADLLYFLGE